MLRGQTAGDFRSKTEPSLPIGRETTAFAEKNLQGRRVDSTQDKAADGPYRCNFLFGFLWLSPSGREALNRTYCGRAMRQFYGSVGHHGAKRTDRDELPLTEAQSHGE